LESVLGAILAGGHFSVPVLVSVLRLILLWFLTFLFKIRKPAVQVLENRPKKGNQTTLVLLHMGNPLYNHTLGDHFFL
jgi:hypothetical protein